MDKHLEQQLKSDYPVIFTYALNPEFANQYAIANGLECHNGWYFLISQLCRSIQDYLDEQAKENHHIEPVVVRQIKEKFGRLRFYYQGGDETVQQLVQLAGHLSEAISDSD